MNFLPTPHLNANKKFLFAVGLWPRQTGPLKYILLFNMLFLTISQGYLQIGGMIAAWANKDVFMESIPPVLVDFVCGAKVVNFIANSRKMEKLLIFLEKDWKAVSNFAELEIMNNYATHGRRLTVSYAGCLYFTMAPFMIIPAVPLLTNLLPGNNNTHVKQLMFRVDYYVDAETYYYPVLIHSYFATMAYITTTIAIDTIFMAYVQHACSSFAILGYKLQHLTDSFDIDVDVYPRKNDDKSYKNMSSCVAFHSHILEYCNLIESANYVSYFFQLGFIMICISFTGFQTVMQLEKPDISARYAAFSFCQLSLLFLQSYPPQMLSDHSIQVSNYINNCRWYQTSIRTRKLVLMMTMRSRRPCVLTAGKFYILNLVNFCAVVRTSMSYLTVLTSVK